MVWHFVTEGVGDFREGSRTTNWAANVACFSDHKIIWNHYESLPLDGRQYFDYDKWRSMQKCFNYDGVNNL